MDNKEWCELFRAYGLNALFVDVSDDGDGELELTGEGKKLVSELGSESPHPTDRISEGTRPTGKEGLKELFRKKFVGRKNRQDVWWVDDPWRVFDFVLEQLSLVREEGRQGLFTKKEWDLILYAVSGNANEDTGDFERLDSLFCDRYGNQLNEVTLKYDKLQMKIRKIIGRLFSLSNQSK
jgi:hypothetical protein